MPFTMLVQRLALGPGVGPGKLWDCLKAMSFGMADVAEFLVKFSKDLCGGSLKMGVPQIDGISSDSRRQVKS